MAQRLVRLVCPKCKERDEPPEDEIKAAGLTPAQAKAATFFRGRGCAHCNHTGYRGRKGIFEMMRMTGPIREMTFAREPTQSIRRQARLLGMRNLLEDGVMKALKGMTTLEEVLTHDHKPAPADFHHEVRIACPQKTVSGLPSGTMLGGEGGAGEA